MKKTKRVITKHDLKWYFALSFVDLAETLGVYYEDKGFKSIVDEMRNYVNDKIDLTVDGEIVKTYVAVVQEVPIKDGEN